MKENSIVDKNESERKVKVIGHKELRINQFRYFVLFNNLGHLYIFLKTMQMLIIVILFNY